MNRDAEAPTIPKTAEDERKQDFGELFGKDFLVFGSNRRSGGSGSGGQIVGVNKHLWRATLDTISFVPLISVDAVGGVVVSDWYAPKPKSPERLKIVVYISGTELRSDAINVKVFKQVHSSSGGWLSAQPSTKTARKLEEIILSKARQLRIQGN
jgi:hypothetical protein